MAKGRRNQRGQVAVETALVMPVVVFVILGIVQLTLAQQARLMLEYAAFSAARAGSVSNLDPEPMRAAATLALLPTRLSGSSVAPGKQAGAVASAGALASALDAALRASARGDGPFGVPQVAVETLNPTPEDFGADAEIAFDDVDERPESRRRTQLTVRVTYFFELRIPLANWLIFEAWYAAKAGVRLFAPDVPGLGAREAPTGAAAPPDRCAPPTGADLQRLGAAAARGRFFLPLTTTWTIRMQSNPFRRFARERAQGC